MILDLDVFGLCAQSRVSPCCCGSKTWTSHQKLPEQDPFDLCANNTWTARSTHVHCVNFSNYVFSPVTKMSYWCVSAQYEFVYDC